MTDYSGKTNGNWTHTAIKVHTCGSCNTVKTFNACFTGTGESE